MIANFVVKTQQQLFPVGTVSSYWRWNLTGITDPEEAHVWQTRDPISSREVTEGQEYAIACYRISDSHEELGPTASVRFTATIVEPPEGEMLDVADSMMVTLQ